jgi:hypothetical protein
LLGGATGAVKKAVDSYASAKHSLVILEEFDYLLFM